VIFMAMTKKIPIRMGKCQVALDQVDSVQAALVQCLHHVITHQETVQTGIGDGLCHFATI